ETLAWFSARKRSHALRSPCRESRRRRERSRRKNRRKNLCMLRTPSIFGPLNSGFVPFASGAPIDEASAAETETAEVIARVSAAPAVEPVESLEVAPRT